MPLLKAICAAGDGVDVGKDKLPRPIIFCGAAANAKELAPIREINKIALVSVIVMIEKKWLIFIIHLFIKGGPSVHSHELPSIVPHLAAVKNRTYAKSPQRRCALLATGEA